MRATLMCVAAAAVIGGLPSGEATQAVTYRQVVDRYRTNPNEGVERMLALSPAERNAGIEQALAASGADAWSWEEIETIDVKAGGAPRAHRDALKLLAVFLQHTDTKPQQQRLVCLDARDRPDNAACARPFMLIQDVGVTFGRASTFNDNTKSSTNLAAWSGTPIWTRASGPCEGNLPKSFTGTLGAPIISEEGKGQGWQNR